MLKNKPELRGLVEMVGEHD